MNYHDTVPYVRRNTENLVDKLEIDINFHFDSKENNVTLEAYELGLEKYKNEHYSVTGLRWDTNLAYMCVHFFREGTNSLWTRNRRDVVLYKIVDVFNVFRAVVNEDNIDAFVRTIKALNLQKACYYTFHYMAQAYEDQAVQYVLTAIEPDNLEFLGEIYHVDKKVTTTRENGYFATAFNLEFCFAKSPVSA
jgi:hypothetical protein